MVQNNQNRTNAIDSYYTNSYTAAANAVANTNNYTPINARTFLQSIGLLPIGSNATTPTNPTPNNNLFSNMNEVLEYANRLRQMDREDTDYAVNRGREIAREAARTTQPHDLNLARIQQSGSLANSNAQIETTRINANAELEKIRMENNNTIAQEERDKNRNRVFSMRTTVPSLTQDEHRYEMEKNNALYRNNLDVTRINADAQLGIARTNADAQLEVARTNNDAQLGIARTGADAELGVARMNNDAQLGMARTNANAQLGVARMNNDAQLEATRTNADTQLGIARMNTDAQLGTARTNADAQLEATRTNADTQLGVARMNNEYGMQTTLLQGSQRQAELDKQGFIQLQLANIDRGQRGYDNMYSMLNQYTNRPRSNFAYWG